MLGIREQYQLTSYFVFGVTTQIAKIRWAHVGSWWKCGRRRIPTFVFVAVFLGCTSTGRVGLCFLWFYVRELPKAQPAVVLVLKRLRGRGNGLKSHPTDWEKPGVPTLYQHRTDAIMATILSLLNTTILLQNPLCLYSEICVWC